MKRILWVLAGAFTFLLFAALLRSEAAPIPPELKKMLVQPQDSVQLVLARAAWDGPEASPEPQPAPNPTLERLGSAATAREAQDSLRRAAIPDYRALAGILLVILLLRRIRTSRRVPLRTADSQPSNRRELPRAA